MNDSEYQALQSETKGTVDSDLSGGVKEQLLAGSFHREGRPGRLGAEVVKGNWKFENKFGFKELIGP